MERYQSLETQLGMYRERLDARHDSLRAELLEGLGRREAPMRRLRLASWMKPARAAAAMAAMLMLVVGILMWSGGSPEAQSAWATDVIEQIKDVKTIHFTLSTPGAIDDGSSVEVWWRKPSDVRMQFSNGPLIVNNQTHRYVVDKNTGKVRVQPSQGLGPEAALLAELGELFPSEAKLSQDVLDKSRTMSMEPVRYRGESCYRVQARRGDDLFEYIVDQDLPLLYEVKRYRASKPGHVISHLRVHHVDVAFPDDLFTVNAKDYE